MWCMSWISSHVQTLILVMVLSLVFAIQCCRRQLKVAVVGVPKTIDNDILLMDKTFGFDTAVEEAQRAIYAAYIEVWLVFPILPSLSSVRIWLVSSLLHYCELGIETSLMLCTHLEMIPSLPWQAHSAYRGVGIVKLMGRSSGFIAMQASLASGQIDICLIPEVIPSIYMISTYIEPCFRVSFVTVLLLNYIN